MLLSARMLAHVTTVNDFDYVDQVECVQGDTVDIYFQLVDLTRAKPIQGWKPAGIRYMPAVGAAMTCRLDNIDDGVAITRTPVQVFPTSDPSIWKISLLPADTIKGTCALNLVLTEPGKQTSCRKEAAVRISLPTAM